MLVWSVGFWLSTGATAGVCVLAPPLAERLPGPAWVRVPLSVTLGAQVGVALPSWLVFHRLPVMSLPANLLAVPVAGFVMLFGIPAGLSAAALPPAATDRDGAVRRSARAGSRPLPTSPRAVEPSPAWAAVGLGGRRRMSVAVLVDSVIAGGVARRCANLIPHGTFTSSPATTSRCCSPRCRTSCIDSSVMVIAR